MSSSDFLENQEPIPVGIQTRTLKQIEDADPIKEKLHQFDIFGGDKTSDQISQLVNIPTGVPYMFGIGGGLHVLYDMNDGEPIWKTTNWDGDPPDGFMIGRIYFTGDDHNDYLQITDSTLGGWVWQKLSKEEELSFKTGKKEWEYKLYFKDMAPKPWMLISLTNQLNEQGWGRASVMENENIEFPDNLELIRLESEYIGQMSRENFLVIDPERAEVVTIRSRDLTEEKEEELKNEGWIYVNSNIARTTYVRTKEEDSEI
jgi:hypothetical protein